ncbi:hypothetical protein IAQ61_008750 [Plenodomus lingam]|uniref:uncharacterized protein n=1 Tax=Leptosphaeria maculans TaxID=5022 RepID=UPI00332B3EB3|nr:hypothetical protein IAQ61_008750 [Plenodomus lingam]
MQISNLFVTTLLPILAHAASQRCHCDIDLNDTCQARACDGYDIRQIDKYQSHDDKRLISALWDKSEKKCMMQDLGLKPVAELNWDRYNTECWGQCKTQAICT